MARYGRVPRGQGLDDGVQEGRIRGDYELIVDLRVRLRLRVRFTIHGRFVCRRRQGMGHVLG